MAAENPKAAQFHDYLSDAYAQKGDVAAARGAYDKALALGGRRAYQGQARQAYALMPPPDGPRPGVEMTIFGAKPGKTACGWRAQQSLGNGSRGSALSWYACFEPHRTYCRRPGFLRNAR